MGRERERERERRVDSWITILVTKKQKLAINVTILTIVFVRVCVCVCVCVLAFIAICSFYPLHNIFLFRWFHHQHHHCIPTIVRSLLMPIPMIGYSGRVHISTCCIYNLSRRCLFNDCSVFFFGHALIRLVASFFLLLYYTCMSVSFGIASSFEKKGYHWHLPLQLPPSSSSSSSSNQLNCSAYGRAWLGATNYQTIVEQLDGWLAQ